MGGPSILRHSFSLSGAPLAVNRPGHALRDAREATWRTGHRTRTETAGAADDSSTAAARALVLTTPLAVCTVMAARIVVSSGDRGHAW